MNQISVIEVFDESKAIYVEAIEVDGVEIVEVLIPGIQGPIGPEGPSGSGNWDLIEGKPDTFPPTVPIPQSDIAGLIASLDAKADVAGETFTGKISVPVSTTVAAGLNIGAPGTAPTAPVSGDLWLSGTTLSVRIATTTYVMLTLAGTQTISGIKTFTAKPIMTTPTTSTASINLPHGAAPTTPVNGDFWTTTLGLYGRINGVNVGPFAGLPIAQVDVTGLTTALAAKAPLASPIFTGAPKAPTLADLESYDDSIATTAWVWDWSFAENVSKTLADQQMAGNLITAASIAGRAGLRVPHGTAPTAPINGDVWTTATGMFARINGANIGPFGPSGVADWANITNKPATFPPTLPIPSSGITGLDTALAGMVLKAGDTMTGKLNTPASTTASAGFNIAPGTGPTAPVDGDLWVVTSSLLWRGGGSTYSAVNLTGTQTISGLKTFSTQVKFFASTTALASINIPSGATPTTPVDGDFWLVGTVYSYRASGSTYNLVNVQGSQTISGIKTFSNKTTFVASATGQASILIPPGVAPSAPVDGDIWTTAAGMYVRINGAVVGPLAASGGPVDWTVVTGKPATFPPALPIAQSGIANLESDLALKAPLASPGLTGVPTAPTAAPGTNTTQIASTAFAAAAATAAATGVANNAVLKAGDTMSGDLTIAKATPFLSLDKAAAGQEAGVFIKTGGVTRWSITSNTAAEAGSDAGSNLAINYHADNGTVKGTINFTRADGKFTAKNISSAGYIQSTPTSGSANFYLDRSAGQSGLINFRTGALARWQINCSNAAESGADAGSNFQIIRSSDAGTQIDTVIDLNRATGLMTVKALTATGKVITPASATGGAGFSMLPGVAPSAPVNGDMWFTSTTLNWQINGNGYSAANTNGAQTFTGAKTFGTKATFFTSATTNASILLPHGVAPSAPVNGDMWTTSAGLFVQIANATVGPLGTGTGGGGGPADWTTITGKPSTFPPDPHVHPQSDITNLVTDLAGKAPIVHTHAQADITNLTTDLGSKLALAGGTMTGNILTPLGAANNLPIQVGGTTNGFYASASALAAVTGGTARWTVSSTGLTMTVPVIIPVGSAAAPSLAITGATNTGIFGTTTSVAISTAGVQRLSIAASALFAVKVTFPASVTASACMNLPQGVAPSAPIDGDVWTTSAGMYVRTNGVIVGPLGAAADWATITGKPATFPPTLPIAQSGITNLESDLAGKASVAYVDTGLGTKAATVHTHAQADITNLVTDLALKAPLNNPVFTGQITMPIGDATTPGITMTGVTNTGIYGTTTSVSFVVSGNWKYSIGPTTASWNGVKVITPASSTTRAGFCLPPGISPTTPAAGDLWGVGAAGLSFCGNDLATYNIAFLQSIQTFSGAKTFTAKPTFTTPSTEAAINLTPAATPSGLVSGDLWFTSTGFFARVAGATVAINDWGSLTSKPATFAPDAHVHAQADITNLVTDLAAKMPLAGGSFTNGVGFGSTTAATATTLTRHLSLYSTTYGFNVTSTVMNYVVPINAAHKFHIGTVNVVSFNSTSTVFVGNKLITAASVTTLAGLNLPHGAAPTTPVDGDMWTTTAGVYARLNGATSKLNVAVGTTAPAAPAVGDIWIDTN